MPFQQGGNYGGGFGGGRGGGFGGRGGGRGGGGGRGRRNDDPSDPNSEQFRKLFIGGLNYDTEEDGLKTYFGKYGEIIDCVVMRDPQSKRSRGFGFVTYALVSEIDEAQNNRPHKLDGKDLDTKRAMPRDQAGNSANQQSVTKMFIGGMKDDTTEDHIKEVFSEFGNIENVELMKDKQTGKMRGFCFVTFTDYDSVDKAVLKKYHGLNAKDVEVKKALPKESEGNRDGGGMKGGMGRSGGGRFGGYDDGNFGGMGGGYGGGGMGGGYGGGQGGYGGGQGGYGGGQGGYGGGYGANQGWGGAGGGYGDYNQSGWGNGGGFGSNYGNNYSAGPMKGAGFNNRGTGPYGGGFGSGGGGRW